MGERVFITIPLYLADFPSTKTAISLPDLVRQTNAFSKKYRPGCTPTLQDSSPKELFLHYNVKCHKEDSDPAGHDVRVKFDLAKLDETKQAKDLDVQVSCSCPAFLYWGAQWNLHQRDGLLDTPRPELRAPTERLDLRGNFVICKHIHAVFERILPSVQHNIVKILREREMARKKDEKDKTPERLLKDQERLRKKQEIEKIRKVKDQKVQEKLLDALRKKEEEKLVHQQELEQGEHGEPEPAVVGRNAEPPSIVTPEAKPAPAPAPARPAPRKPREEEAIEELTNDEQAKIEEAHEKGEPHLHTGLPYKPREEE
jgi:hypothetical protein